MKYPNYVCNNFNYTRRVYAIAFMKVKHIGKPIKLKIVYSTTTYDLHKKVEICKQMNICDIPPTHVLPSSLRLTPSQQLHDLWLAPLGRHNLLHWPFWSLHKACSKINIIFQLIDKFYMHMSTIRDCMINGFTFTLSACEISVNHN
jgi:hypothetical protein